MRMKKKLTMTVLLRYDHIIKTTQPISMILVDHSFQKTMHVLLVEYITPKEQWNAAIFSTAISLGTNIPWVGRIKNLLEDTLYLCK